MAGINMADWPKNHHIIPAINIPPKVTFSTTYLTGSHGEYLKIYGNKI